MSRRDRFARALRVLALAMMAVAALFGVPIVIDPPPRDRSAECQTAPGKGGDRRRRGGKRA